MQTVDATDRFDLNFNEVLFQLFNNTETEDDYDYSESQVRVRVEDDYGWDDLVDLGNGVMLFTDRNSGVHSIVEGIDNTEQFVKQFLSYF